MTGESPTLPDGIDPDRPSSARVYDCFLGGTHNFASDRAVAAKVIEAMPVIPDLMRANRAFLRRAVCAVTAAGIEQFLDLGAGIPTEGPVHEIARIQRPEARVVYVDIDPMAAIYSRTILGEDPHCAVIQADLNDVDRILDDPQLTSLLDRNRPICLILLAVLHFMPDTNAVQIMLERYREALPPGSYMIISHATRTGDPTQYREAVQVYAQTTAPIVPRDRDEIANLLTGWEQLDPGVVHLSRWRPDPGEQDFGLAGMTGLAVVARKR
jgi:O-methyltransferase involved in polyketide biosynthesis